jgi:hypothetical protein
MAGILLPVSKRGINVPHDESKIVRALTLTGAGLVIVLFGKQP